MEKNTKILICDENAEERERIIDNLSKSGFERIDVARDGINALELIVTNRYDIVILDLWI